MRPRKIINPRGQDPRVTNFPQKVHCSRKLSASSHMYLSPAYVTFPAKTRGFPRAKEPQFWHRSQNCETDVSSPPVSTTKTASLFDTSFVRVHCPRPTRSPTRAVARVIFPRRCRPFVPLALTPRRPTLPSPCNHVCS